MEKNCKYNKCLMEYGVTKEMYEESLISVTSAGIKGKVVSSSTDSHFMAFEDGGVGIINKLELEYYQEK